jgi:hypothetical protein
VLCNEALQTLLPMFINAATIHQSKLYHSVRLKRDLVLSASLDSSSSLERYLAGPLLWLCLEGLIIRALSNRALLIGSAGRL